VPKGEFIEVYLELGLAHTVVGANEPPLDVADGSIGKGDSGLRTFSQCRAERLDTSDMFKAGVNETCETLEAVRIDRGTRCNVAGKYRDDGAGLEVGNHVHSNSTGRLTTLFHGHQDESRSSVLELPAPAQPGLLAANPRVINLYLAMQGLPNGIHHRPAKFVQHHPRGLVAAKTELTLQQQSGHATLVSRHQIRRPKPVGQWNLGAVKDRPGCQRNLVPTFGALVAPLFHQFIRSFVPASRASKAIRPTARRQILLASLLCGEVGLKLAKRLGE
jgi:hypothetical protein